MEHGRFRCCAHASRVEHCLKGPRWRQPLWSPHPSSAARTPPASSRSASGTTGCPAPTRRPKTLCKEWGEKEKVEVSIDYITSQGNKNLLTIAAEAQARSGHDILAFPTWQPADHAKQSRAGRRHHGRADQAATARSTRPSSISARSDGKWLAVPATRRQPDQGPVLAHRPDEAARRHRRAGDVSGRRARPRPTAGPSTPSSRPPRPATRAAIRSASASARPRTTSTPPARSSSPSAPSWSTPRATSRSRPTRCARRSSTTRSWSQFLPPDAPAWDDASNNKWLVSGKGALIMNPPSAWAVAKRDAPQVAEQCWTHGMPVGPEGPLRAVPAVLLGHLELQQEQVGGQEPAAAPVAAGGGREDGGGERRLRPAVVREADHASRPGPRKGRRRARSTTIPTRTTTRSCRSPRRRRRRRSPSRSTRRRIHDQDGRALHAGRGDGEDAGLGRERGRRLHAHLELQLPGCACRAIGRAAARCIDCDEVAPMVDAAIATPRSPAAARRRIEPAQAHAAQVDHRLPDGAAADPADRAAGDLSGALLDPSGDAEQVDGALRRPRQLRRSCSSARRSGWWCSSPASSPSPP